MKDINNYRYHKDSRYPEAKKWRDQVEFSAEEQEKEEVAEDIIESMNEDLNKALGLE